LLSSLLKEKKK